MCPLNKRVLPGQSAFQGCFGLDCVPQLGMRCCTHGFVSRNVTPFCSGAACQYFPMIAQQKVPAGTDRFISRCKCKGGGGSIGMVIHWSPPLDFSDKDKTLPLRLECSSSLLSGLQANPLGLLDHAMYCSKAFHNSRNKVLLKTGGKKEKKKKKI